MAGAMDFSKECCLCLKNFTDPRVLPCLHTFCSKCLENMGAIVPNDWMLCPVCGSKFTVPEEGILGLPKNIFAEKFTNVRTNSTAEAMENTLCDACSSKVDLVDKGVAEKYCINCEKKLCKKCCEEHKESKQHLVVNLGCQKVTKTEEKEESDKVCRCRVHQEEIPELYCTSCKKVICNKCFTESHSSHICSDVKEVVNVVCKQAEKECTNIENVQCEFQLKSETLHRVQMKFLEHVKKMETEILKRCEEIKELVVKKTKALLQELAVLKAERLKEIEMEHKRLDKHVFTLEKFKEYCAWIKSNGAHSYTCESECILRSTADELKVHQKTRIGIRLLSLHIELQTTDTREFVMPISNSIGQIKVTSPFNMKLPTKIDTGGRNVYGIASLQDKLYLLSQSVWIHRAEDPYDCIGEIKLQDVKSPTIIVSCPQTSCLYIYDKGNACIWRVSISDQQVKRWFDNVLEPCTLSVTPNGEILMATQSTDIQQQVAVELYNRNAILIERIEVPKDIKVLQHILKTPSGDYIGYGDNTLYKFRSDGSIVCRSDIRKYPDIAMDLNRCLEVSPYYLLLISCNSLNFKVSLVSSDLNVQRTLPGIELTERSMSKMHACYANETKRLAVLGQANVRVGGGSLEMRGSVTVYKAF